MRTQITRDILSYLLDNRGARDTLNGIVEWWLLERHVRRGVNQVEQVLLELTSRGFIIEQKAADGRVHYQINPQKEAEIAEVIRERADDNDGIVP
ncbi:MAG: hypothetical protein EHM23_08150 [Acidobacteria bacterium]|nr:MAG: hypothetical protein EHM23_08150 [Acidobacteriota bacterium]